MNPLHLDRRCVSGGQNLRFACAGPQKMHLGSSKFAFRLRETLGRTVFPAQGHTKRVSGAQNLRFACAGPQKMHLGSSKFAFRLRETLGRTVFPAQGHTKRVSGAQNLRFACAKRSRGSRPDCFPCAGPRKTRLRRSKFAFRLRRATKSDDKDAIRHESETWILQKLLRYIYGC